MDLVDDWSPCYWLSVVFPKQEHDENLTPQSAEVLCVKWQTAKYIVEDDDSEAQQRMYVSRYVERHPAGFVHEYLAVVAEAEMRPESQTDKHRLPPIERIEDPRSEHKVEPCVTGDLSRWKAS